MAKKSVVNNTPKLESIPPSFHAHLILLVEVFNPPTNTMMLSAIPPIKEVSYKLS
jgi:hypothetical protein